MLKNRIKSNNKFVIGMMMLVLLSACSFLPREEETLAPPLIEPVKIEYETTAVEIKKITKQITGLGNLVPSKQQNLFFTGTSGRIDEIKVELGEQVKKGQVLVEMDTGNLAFDIQQSEIDLKKAKLRLDQLQQQNADKYSIEIAKLDIQSVEVRLKQMKQQAANAKLLSPIDGLITFVTEKERGDHVEAYEDLMQVADPKNVQLVYTAISSGELSEVNVGMKAVVELNGKPLNGQVVQTPSTVPAEIKELNPDLYGRSLILSVEDLPSEVTAGDAANMTITIQEKENALTIPKSALRSAFGREYVQVLEGETKREKDIKKGIVSDTEVEILEGLNEGDLVISN